MKTGIIALAVLAAVLAATASAAPPVAPRDVADEDVDRVITETIRYLWAQQNREGYWDHWLHRNRRMFEGGATALSLFALLEAGEDLQDPRMVKGVEWLVKLKTDIVYVRAVRIMVLSQMVGTRKDSPYRKPLQDDIAWLTGKALQEGGAWGYRGPERHGDNSCSQFALLALWEAQWAGIDIPAQLLRVVEQTWLRRQHADGGWTYAGQPNVDTASTISMTTAGIASLYVCQDVLSLASGAYPQQRKLDAAWQYAAAGLKNDYIKDGYLAFCVQRIGMAGGQKFIGDMDWFAVGAGELAKPQPRGREYRGQWGPITDAAFQLIFMARGRTPLTYNKLEHGADGQWNFHGRDVPRFTEYMRRNFELRLRWQVVKITDDIRLLLDAPILLAAGSKELDFTGEQWAKLREYTLRGGTLLLVPVGGSRPFTDSARAKLAELYAEQRDLAGGGYALETLPPDHPVYNAHEPMPQGAEAAPIQGISDGTRLLAILCQRDICASWQRRQEMHGRADYVLGVNLYFYATGGNPMRMRMRPVFQGAGTQVRHKVRLAWLKHGGNWHTQPHGLEYLSQKLTAENRAAIETTAGVPLEPDKLRGHHIAWMTGSSKFDLSEAELEALRTYLAEGGTLFVNALGGSREFNDSARAMLKALFPAGAGDFASRVTSGVVSSDSPLITGKLGDFRGPPLEKLDRTKAWQLVAREAGPPLTVYAQHGRVLAIYAPFGVHDTLDGHTAHGAMSYLPRSARDIAANVVLYGLMDKSKMAPPATQTAPAPTTGPTPPVPAPATGPTPPVPATPTTQPTPATTSAPTPSPTPPATKPVDPFAP